MFPELKTFMRRPNINEEGTLQMWTDSHISNGMLKAHLNPDQDGATRKHDTVTETVKWLTKIAPPKKYKHLLDLGCGPGIYAEKFYKEGYEVTGLDFSKRAIDYARKSAKENDFQITYQQDNYLNLSAENQFDVITLIYCDFGALSADDRKILLKNIHRALKPNGLFIFDVFTPKKYSGLAESKTWSYEEAGFFKEIPHVCLTSLYHYDDEKTFCNQYLLLSEGKVDCINVWEQTFEVPELKATVEEAGFSVEGIYSDIMGAEHSETSETLCFVVRKQQS